MSAYSPEEREAIAGWLKQGLSAGRIAEHFGSKFRRNVSRNAIIGIIHRDKQLSQIGLPGAAAGGRGWGQGKTKRPASPSVKHKSIPARPKPVKATPPVTASRAPAIEAVASTRTIDDMISGRNAPLPPGADPAGVALEYLDNRQCRFTVAHPPEGARFCAAEVLPADWMPGHSGGCYCRFHRGYLKRQPSVRADDDKAGFRPKRFA